MNFFEKYGPSARDCYTFCHADVLNLYDTMVRKKVKQIGWDLLTDLLIWPLSVIEMDQASDMLILVQPRPNNRAVWRTTIVTETVSQLLWDRDSNEQWRNHHKLLKTLRLEPSAKALCGLVFEPAFHEMCVRGASLPIYSITEFTNDLVKTSETLTLNKQTRISFSRNYPIDILLANHYYQPTASNNLSFDSFVYDPNHRRISAFQVTVAEELDLASKDLYALRELGDTLQIDDLKIRVIMVVFESDQIAFTVNKGLYDDLGLEVYAIRVTEKQLFPHLHVYP